MNQEKEEIVYLREGETPKESLRNFREYEEKLRQMKAEDEADQSTPESKVA